MTAAVQKQRKSLEPYLRDDVEFYPHQVDGVRKLVKLTSFILGDDMGLGKSLQALTLFCIDVKLGNAETLLVVCPVSLRRNWAHEVEKFTRLPCTLLGEEPDPKRHSRTKRLSPKRREEQLQEFVLGIGPRILVANYEQMCSVVHKNTLDHARFDIIAFDEAHFIKNSESKRTLASLRLMSKRSFLITGTPLLNQVNELWPLFHRIDPVRFPEYWRFRNRYCVFGGWEGRQIVGTKNEAELISILGQFMLRRLKDDVLTLPKPYYIQVPVDLSPAQQKLYDEVEDELRVNGDDIKGDLVRFLRLKQICATPFCIDEELPDESYKLDRAVEIIKEITARGEKIVVFTQFRPVITALDRRLSADNQFSSPVFQLHGGIKADDRQGVIGAWGSVKGASVILCMLQVAGIGLNMVQARTALFIDKLYVPGLNRQAVDRIHRIGQDEGQPVQVYELLARGTVEDRIEQILAIKSKLFGEIVEGGVGMRKLLEALKEDIVNARVS